MWMWVKSQKLQFLTSALLLIVILINIFIYWPGLHGIWLLDDHYNLTHLNQVNNDFSINKIIHFSLEGAASSIGRPLTLLTFALQSHSWIEDIESFKYVNLMIHLINTLLLFLVFFKIGRLLHWSLRQSLFTALLTILLWSLHPIQVSTVLYVIQRMTSLSALFMLITLLCYLNLKDTCLEHSWYKYLFQSIGIVFFSGCALLSKENGILVFIYIFAIEKILLRFEKRSLNWKIWSAFFIYVPCVFIFSYLIFNLPQWIEGYQTRDFTLTERLLTESRALTDYLWKLFFPRSKAFGLYFDDFQISRSLLKPPTTIFSIIFICSLLFISIKFRKRISLISFGILWFFSGHLIESTVISLEPYWEHRNYLPIAGPLFIFSYYTYQGANYLSLQGKRWLVVSLITVMLLLIGNLTWQEACLWGKPLDQAAIWAKEKPNSRRAQEGFAGTLAIFGQIEQSFKQYAYLVESDPDQRSRYYASWLILACSSRDVSLPDQEKFKTSLLTAPFSLGPINSFIEIVDMIEKKHCLYVNPDYMLPLLQAILDNRRYESLHYYVYFLVGRLYAEKGLLDPAMQALDEANQRYPQISIITYQIDWLVSAQLYDDALKYVSEAKSLSIKSKIKSYLYAAEIDAWEEKIKSMKYEYEKATTLPMDHNIND